MITTLSISPTLLLIDGGRVSSEKKQIWKNGGTDTFKFVTGQSHLFPTSTPTNGPYNICEYYSNGYAAHIRRVFFSGGLQVVTPTHTSGILDVGVG